MTLFNKFLIYSPKRWQIVTSILVILISGLVMVGWVFKIDLLKSGLPNLPSMKVNTALGFILVGVTLWLLRDEPLTPRRRRAAQICAAVLFLIGLLTLAEYLFGWNLGIDQLLFQDSLSSVGTAFPGRMAEATAFSFVLLALAFWIIRTDHNPSLSQFLALIVGVFALFSLAGYLFEAPALYGLFHFSAMSFLSAITLLSAAISVLSTRPHQGWVSVLTTENAGGVMARRLLPAVVIIPMIIGWARLKGQWLGLYGTELGLALFALSNILLFALLVWWGARLLNRVDAERRQSAERVRKLNRTLTVLSDVNQVIVRTRHLPALYEKICQIAVELGGFRMAWIGLIDPGTQKVRLVAHAGASNEYQASLNRIVGNEARMQGLVASLSDSIEHVFYNDLQHDPRLSAEQHADMVELHFHSLALLPLRVSGELRGFLNLAVDEPNFFDAEELRLLDEMAGDIAFAMEFAEQEEQRQKSEAVARQTEIRYRNLLDNLLEGAQIIGFDWRYLYVNDASANRGGQSKEILLGSTVTERYPGIEHTDLFAALRTCMQERTSQHIETEFALPDGTSTWFELSVQPVPEGIFILSLDISERKQSELDLMRYAERLEILHEIDSSLIRGDSTQELIESTLLQVRQIIPCQRVDVSLLDEAANEMVIFALAFDGSTALTLGSRFAIPPNVFEGYDERHLRAFDDLRLLQETRPRAKQLVSEGLLSALSVLLMDQDHAIGSFSLFADTPGFFTTEHQEIVAEITNQLAIAVRQMRLTSEIAQHTAELERSLHTIDDMRQFLQTTLDAFPADVAVLDPDGTVINVNAAWRNFSFENGGLSPSAYLNSNYLTICDTAFGEMSEEAAAAAAGIRSVINGQPEFYLEYPCHSPVQERWFGMRVTPFPEPTPRRVVIAHMSITERKESEDALREANETLEHRVLERTVELNHAKEHVEAILNNSSDGILLTDADLRILQTNPAFDTLFLYAAADASACHLLDFIHPDDAGRLVELIQMGMAERIGKRIELLGLRTNGTTFDAGLSIGYFVQEQGREGLVCTVRDITERKHEQQILAEERNLLRTLIDTTPDYIYIKDTEHRFLLSNIAHARARGKQNPEELIGKTDFDFFPAEKAEQFRSEEAEMFRSGQPMLDYEQASNGFSGGFAWASTNKVPLHSLSGELIGLVGITRDISERKHADEILRESEKKFRSLVQAAPISTVITNQLGEIILVNQQSENLFGYTSAELLEQPVEVLMPQAVRERHVHHRAGYAAAPRVRRKDASLELYGRRKDGSEFPAQIELSYVETETGLLVITFIVDITERKERERQLRFSASLQQSVSDAVISTDLQFRIQSWNPAAERIYGWRAEEVLGKNVTEILKTRFSTSETVEQVRRDFLEKGYWTGEAIQSHRDGHPIPILSSTVLFRDESGQSFGVVSVNHDITERKRVEEAVRESEARYRLLADAINDVVIRFTPAFDYLYVSPSSRTILGYDPDELLGKSDFQRIHPDDTQAIRELVTRLIKSPGSAVITYRFRHKQGHYLWLEGTGRAIVSEQTGEVVEFVFSLRDVTVRKQVEEAVRESEARYRMLADNISDLITTVDTSGNYIYVSPSSRTVLGYEPLELIGTSAFALIHPDDIAGLIAVQTALQDANYPAVPTNYRSRHKDGHYIWFETSGQIIWSEDKTEMLGFITVSRDITERKRAAEALALSEQRFTLLVNSVPDYAIYMLDPQGNIASWNSGAENIKGYSSEEIIGQNFSRFYTAEAIAQNEPQAILRIAADKGHYVGEGWRVRKDGSRFWAEVLITSLRDSQNQLIGFSKVTRDLTERKRVEDALLEQRDFLQLVIDNVPGLIMVKDRKGRFQLVNNMIAEVYGLTPVDMIGRTDADINPHQDQVAFFTQKDQETLLSGEPVFIPEEMLLDRYYQTSKIPLRKVGGVYDRLLIVASDITERKNAEEALRFAFQEEKELGDLKSRFVSMASHEFRTPLATILAAAETLGAYRQRMTEPQIDHRVNIVRDQVEHLKNIIEDVLQLTRIQAGRLDFTPTIFDLDSLCRSVIDEFESRPDVTHPLVYRCDTLLHETKLDKKLMRQIINNLVSNAIKYSPEAKEVFITLEQRDENLVLSVRDQGIGIPELDLKHLYEPFHRAANVGSISGTGLGLSITKEAVELHGGKIQVDSQVNVGTTVTVIIPISKTIGNDHDEDPGH